MAKRTVVQAPATEEQGKFLLAWHDGVNTKLYASPNKDRLADLALPPFVVTAIDEQWEGVAHFVADVQANVVHTKRSDTVPVAKAPRIDERWSATLDEKEMGLAFDICATDQFAPSYRDIIRLWSHVDDSGQPRTTHSAVTKNWLKEKHLPFCLAIAELEKKWRKRSDVLKEVEHAISFIKAL